MSDKRKVVVLLSGGMDSVTAFYQALQEYDVVAGVSFDYGSKHNHKEIPFAKHHCDATGVVHQVITMGFVNDLFQSDLLQSGGDIPEGHYAADNMKQTVVPFRNGIMISIAAGYAESLEADGLVIAAHAGDHTIYPDCREEFMKAMGNAIAYGTYAEIELIRPFIESEKADVASMGRELGVDYSKTWSCYKGGDIHCGKCGTCVERREAFMDSGVPDPTAYEHTGPLPEKPDVPHG
jgi:7-cyano-7-deazaguanine synthase